MNILGSYIGGNFAQLCAIKSKRLDFQGAAVVLTNCCLLPKLHTHIKNHILLLVKVVSVSFLCKTLYDTFFFIQNSLKVKK